MKYLIFGVFLSLSSVSLGQQNSDFIGCWIDSREENIFESGTNIYRHCDFKEFSASRFRFTMELKANQQCSWLSLASNDGHRMQEGTWIFEEKSMTLRIFDSELGEVEKFVISIIDDDRLVIVN